MDDNWHFTTYVRADADAVWRLLTDRQTQGDWYLPALDWDLRDGGSLTWGRGGEAAVAAEVVAVRPEHRYLAHSFAFAFLGEAPGMVRWRVTPMGEVVQVWLRHQLDGSPQTTAIVGGSWSVMLARLKTLAETGVPLPEPVWPSEGWDADPD